jgi:putative Holliday junction resolvase
MRLMGLDIGSRTIGVALSDELGWTAQGLKTIRRGTMEQDLTELLTIINTYQVEKVVVGLPRNMDGTLGPQAEKVFGWIKAFRKKISLPVVTRDERLTTVGATRILLEGDLSRERRKQVVDQVAASLILQGYLDQRMRRDNSSAPT